MGDKFEQSIVATQVNKQLKRTREMEQLAASIRADTSVKISEYKKQMQVLLQGGDANKTLSIQLAEAKAAKNTIEMEAKAAAYVKKKLGLSSRRCSRTSVTRRSSTSTTPPSSTAFRTPWCRYRRAASGSRAGGVMFGPDRGVLTFSHNLF